ncbi:DUF4382 domain-containing protein [Ramlibacter sp. AN1015]|uniref:DUF4382 domain-containing protein n=1 Tax=Ramlibacter sp. AN1015 TaxID=3133428 RepID=UPI0030C0618C
MRHLGSALSRTARRSAGRRSGATLAMALLLAACGGGGGDSGSIGPPPVAGATGTLSINITDAPIDAAIGAVVQFAGVALKRFGEPETVIAFDVPLRIDLLSLRPGESLPLLPATSVPAGAYESMRLLIDSAPDSLDSHLVLAGGAQRPLYVPAAAASGLRLGQGFTVPAGGLGAFTIDFDLRQSVLPPVSSAGPFPMRPILRLVDNARIGAVAGTVTPATLTNASCPFPLNPALNSNQVYVFAGWNVAPDDIDRSAPEPVTTATVGPTVLGAWSWRAAFLPPGPYTVAFTCQGALDNPETSEALTFFGARNVTVQADATTLVDF